MQLVMQALCAEDWPSSDAGGCHANTICGALGRFAPLRGFTATCPEAQGVNGPNCASKEGSTHEEACTHDYPLQHSANISGQHIPGHDHGCLVCLASHAPQIEWTKPLKDVICH